MSEALSLLGLNHQSKTRSSILGVRETEYASAVYEDPRHGMCTPEYSQPIGVTNTRNSDL